MGVREGVLRLMEMLHRAETPQLHRLALSCIVPTRTEKLTAIILVKVMNASRTRYYRRGTGAGNLPAIPHLASIHTLRPQESNTS